MPIRHFLFALAFIHGAMRYSTSSAQAIDQGYQCNGMIIKKDSSSNDISADNLICCEGDPHQAILLGGGAPTSCTAGTAVPLTKETPVGTKASATSLATTSTAVATETTAASQTSSSNAAAPGLITGDTWIGAGIAAWGVLAAI